MVDMSSQDMSVTEWMAAVYNRPWQPTREKPLDERIIDYIKRLERQIETLEKFRTDEMWRRDQASPYRMGL